MPAAARRLVTSSPGSLDCIPQSGLFPGTLVGVSLALAALTLLSGVVMRGPITPVCRVGMPCNEPAVGAVLVFSRDGRTAARVKVGAGGHYLVRLAPGTYVVQQSPLPKIGFGIRPGTVVVRRVATRANFYIDTGIR